MTCGDVRREHCLNLLCWLEERFKDGRLLEHICGQLALNVSKLRFEKGQKGNKIMWKTNDIENGDENSAWIKTWQQNILDYLSI